MKLYLWHYVDGVTANYHNEGGVVIVTDRSYADVWAEYVQEHDNSYGDLTKQLPEPDMVLDIAGHADEDAIVFPDAGCC